MEIGQVVLFLFIMISLEHIRLHEQEQERGVFADFNEQQGDRF
jgi:hypothetical protein